MEPPNKKTAWGKAVFRKSVLDVLSGVKCHLVLTSIVERMQREFSLAEHVAGSAEKPEELESDVLILIEPYPWVHPDER